MRNTKIKYCETPDLKHESGKSRRSFLKKATAASLTLTGTNLLTLALDSCTRGSDNNELPWFRRVKRWGQVNITLDNAADFDIAWWRKYWKRTNTQGIVLNAGGIYAFYPSKIPLHFRAPLLGDKDLFGDLCKAAHDDGLVVFARMDSGRVNEDFFKAHPDWFAINAEGKPYIREGLYTTCINGPYYNQHIPSILTEIASTYHPEGITDNSWEGLGRSSPCYCENCRRSFSEKSGLEIPVLMSWDNPDYREWIQWNFDRRLEIWEMFNQTTKTAGGPDCTWSGMISSSISGQSSGFCDLKKICDRADIVMIDAQARTDLGGFSNTFQQNSDTGKRIHGLIGWDKVTAESMAIYQAGTPRFRLSSKPAPEAHMWMISGISGGIAPWWHHVSGYHEDRRRYKTVEPIYIWHRANERFLFERTPVATVGVVWSQDNTTWFGRDNANFLVDQPSRGITQALVRARIPYMPVNADQIDLYSGQISLLILPNIGTMTDDQVASVRRFVEKGGGLIATGQSSLYDKFGDRRSDYALGDLFGVHYLPGSGNTSEAVVGPATRRSYHTYLRLTPELRKKVDGPLNGTEPEPAGERHQVLKGFEETDIFPYGGLLQEVITDPGAKVLMTFIPAFPTMPPEDAWMRIPGTDIPGLILNTTSNGSRVAFMPADIDRQFANDNLPDHGNLIANLVSWAAKDNVPLTVEGAGLIDCNLYKQPGRLIFHINNLVNVGTWRQTLDEYIPIGPLTFKIHLPEDVTGSKIKLLVSEQIVSPAISDNCCSFTLSKILNHEIVIIS